jgi:polyhydroxyalkanoate synthesis regulator phasin
MTDDNGRKRELTMGEKAVNWAKALGIILPMIGAGVVSTLGYFKSDSAEVGVDSLVKQLDKRVAKQEKVINAQSEQLEKMMRRLIFFQAHQEGVSAGKLSAKVEDLEKRLAELKAKKIPHSVRTERIVEILRGSKVGTRKLSPPPAKPKPDKVQSIPRIKSAPFLRKGK